MKRFSYSLWLTAAIAVLTLFPALQHCAAEDEGQLLLIPDEHPGPPYYMFLLEHESQDVVPLVFIRQRDCIPEEFNLLEFFHVGPGGAQSCPLNVEGFQIASQPVGPPTLQHLQNPKEETVPIWFVSREEYLSEIDDGVLKIGDIEQMDSLVLGLATLYEETQSVLVPQPKATIVAHGLLEDGRSFRIHLEEHFTDVGAEVVHYDIVISD
jgi:hypothetical protein